MKPNYRIVERNYGNGKIEFYPEIMSESPVYGKWENVGEPRCYFVGKSYDEALLRIREHWLNTSYSFVDNFFNVDVEKFPTTQRNFDPQRESFDEFYERQSKLIECRSKRFSLEDLRRAFDAGVKMTNHEWHELTSREGCGKFLKPLDYRNFDEWIKLNLNY